MDRVRIFNKYLVCYGPDEPHTGIKGIRSDAPPEVIEAYLQWYRDNNRYKSGRMHNKDAGDVKSQIIDISNIEM